MSKYNRIILILMMFIVAGVFLFYANILTNEIESLEYQLFRWYSESNPQCYHATDPFICERLKRLCELQLKLTTLLHATFTVIGYTLITFGIIYALISIEWEEWYK